MLRKRKNRRYNETNDDDGEKKFNILEQIKSERFDHQIKDKHLQELSGEAITLRLIQRHGFEKPILVTKPDGLDLRVPAKSFLVRDVRNCVGHDRIIDVMDVKTQKNIEMSMKDWCKYYESKNRDRLLNVISLEFSHTKLDELVESPMIVRLLDWVDLVWPKFLKQSQTESTNTIDKMKYPKVQKYCLMSVKGSYTDFHIDFGGTSVWYHILKGKKIFWMVPPTELNLQVFEEWTLSGMQQDVFFGDTVEECFRVELQAGNTFFIPSGWIHAVYTLEDSLVFGGNFLHSFGIENQLKVSRIEDATKVPVKFRYPFYTEILWYVVQHYVYSLTAKDHLHRPDIAPAAAAAVVQQASSNSNKNKNKANSIEIEDETTESEQDESDTKSNTSKKRQPRANAATKRKQSKQNSAAAQQSRSKKRPPPPPTTTDDDDDSSTEIDSSNEEEPPPKPPTNTCRMTKNSLLRLQYEVESQQQQATTTSPNKSHNSNNNRSIKSENKCDKSSGSTKTETTTQASKKQKTTPTKQEATPIPPVKQESIHLHQVATPTNQPPSTTTTTALNLAEIVMSHENNKSNGWSAGGWSNRNSESKEPKWIHITKYELNGLKVLVKHLSKLSGAKKNLPNLIRNSRALLDDCRKLIVEHENDDPELAITGKPITPDLLQQKTTDINELIGQFFKPSETTKYDETASLAVPSSNFNNRCKAENSLLSSTATTPSASSQHRLKSSSHSADGGGDGDQAASILSATSGSSTSSATSDNNATKPLSPHKETKCLSPNKKLSSSAAACATSATTTSQPPRPKSPPTRPLSNNQYTSKQQQKNNNNNNNLLLPGSFADLIAATSTEKKVFDVTGADVASSLFCMKDLSSSNRSTATANSTPSPSSSSTINSVARAVGSKERKSGVVSHKSSSSSASQPDDSQQPTISTSSGAGAGTTTYQSTKEQAPKVNSPEPPKAAVQKRFINPAGFRPAQNKEKLIYASAPYISPVHASEQSRAANYPWQVAAQPPPLPPPPHHQQYPQQHQHHQHHQASSLNPPVYSPTAPRPVQHSSASVSGSSGQPGFKPDAVDPIPPSHPPPSQQQQQPIKPVDKVVASDDNSKQQQQKASNNYHSQVNAIVAPHKQQHSTLRLDESIKSTKESSANRSVVDQPATAPVSAKLTTALVKIGTIGANHASNSSTGESVEPKAKKPAKPRGPPKKSKEARQAIQVTSVAEQKSLPVSVIKLAPPSVAGSSSVPAGQHEQHTTVVKQSPPQLPAPAPPPPKATKAKRTKKQKDESVTESDGRKKTASSSSTVIKPQLVVSSSNQASVIHALVTPQQPASSTNCTSSAQAATAAATAAKLNPTHSYLISRPLLFNTMPTFSAAQFQQMPRGSMPLLAGPMGTPLGMPLQQGARLVWATAPRNLVPTSMATSIATRATIPLSSTGGLIQAPSLTSLAQSTAKTTTVPSRPQQTPVSSSFADNAALLSLATTALSTAPMVSSPALSHLNAHTPTPQAIMVSQANQRPAALFAAAHTANHHQQQQQQLFRPFMPRMPMTHFVAARPGHPRPSTGQLVFARLPNQNQQRYLITQPGFMQQHQHLQQQQQLQQQRFPGPQIVTSQPGSTLAYATFTKPPTSDPTKQMKAKKVKTS